MSDQSLKSSFTADMLFLEDTLRTAGTAIIKLSKEVFQVRAKPDDSLVTDADLAAEKIIITKILERYPSDLILSEETSPERQRTLAGKYIWVIDPLDGTTNFANGYPYFCTTAARGLVLPNGQIKIITGGIYDRLSNHMFIAQLGQGAYLNGETIRVKEARPLASALLVTGFYYKKGSELDREISRFAKVAQICSSIRRDGAAALDLAYVSCGIFDAFWESGLKPWDVAAGSLLVSEAGGVVQEYPRHNDVTRTEIIFDIEAGTIVAGSAKMVEQLQDLL